VINICVCCCSQDDFTWTVQTHAHNSRQNRGGLHLNLSTLHTHTDGAHSQAKRAHTHTNSVHTHAHDMPTLPLHIELPANTYAHLPLSTYAQQQAAHMQADTPSPPLSAHTPTPTIPKLNFAFTNAHTHRRTHNKVRPLIYLRTHRQSHTQTAYRSPPQRRPARANLPATSVGPTTHKRGKRPPRGRATRGPSRPINLQQTPTPQQQQQQQANTQAQTPTLTAAPASAPAARTKTHSVKKGVHLSSSSSTTHTQQPTHIQPLTLDANTQLLSVAAPLGLSTLSPNLPLPTVTPSCTPTHTSTQGAAHTQTGADTQGAAVSTPAAAITATTHSRKFKLPQQIHDRVMTYATHMLRTFNSGNLPDLVSAVDRACSPRCLLRIRLVKTQYASSSAPTPTNANAGSSATASSNTPRATPRTASAENPDFADLDVPRDKIVDFFRGISEAFPDGIFQTHVTKIQPGQPVVVATKYSFSGELCVLRTFSMVNCASV
jgi:hypothetical protein